MPSPVPGRGVTEMDKILPLASRAGRGSAREVEGSACPSTLLQPTPPSTASVPRLLVGTEDEV